ncbi:hypothetical protein [Silvanigrella aquatica]|uniref:Uncharacterized protein n=1 Tax=Silvanigrella aquatica TaxID=1915309 RepID=A0A1L4D2A5_9BACT|nr:hypothetical protein [Silvanigrella aquatica]APJ04326.1 hypothetical protein AXG55_10580 [Silvanigrella aquatica]
MKNMFLKFIFMSILFTLSTYTDNEIQDYVFYVIHDSEQSKNIDGILVNVVANIQCNTYEKTLSIKNFNIQEEGDNNYLDIPVKKGENCQLNITQFEFKQPNEVSSIKYSAKAGEKFSIPLNYDHPIKINTQIEYSFESTPVDGEVYKMDLKAVTVDNPVKLFPELFITYP